MSRRLVTPLNESRVLEVAKFRARLRNGGMSLRRVQKSLKTALAYFTEKEENDFYDADHTAPIQRHIYGDLIVLSHFLNGGKR